MQETAGGAKPKWHDLQKKQAEQKWQEQLKMHRSQTKSQSRKEKLCTRALKVASPPFFETAGAQRRVQQRDTLLLGNTALPTCHTTLHGGVDHSLLLRGASGTRGRSDRRGSALQREYTLPGHGSGWSQDRRPGSRSRRRRCGGRRRSAPLQSRQSPRERTNDTASQGPSVGLA